MSFKNQFRYFLAFLNNCTMFLNKDPLFSDHSNNNYQINTGSASIAKGLKSIAKTVPFDILRHNRTTNIAPDIGAYEAK